MRALHLSSLKEQVRLRRERRTAGAVNASLVGRRPACGGCASTLSAVAAGGGGSDDYGRGGRGGGSLGVLRPWWKWEKREGDGWGI